MLAIVARPMAVGAQGDSIVRGVTPATLKHMNLVKFQRGKARDLRDEWPLAFAIEANAIGRFQYKSNDFRVSHILVGSYLFLNGVLITLYVL